MKILCLKKKKGSSCFHIQVMCHHTRLMQFMQSWRSSQGFVLTNWTTKRDQLLSVSLVCIIVVWLSPTILSVFYVCQCFVCMYVWGPCARQRPGEGVGTPELGGCELPAGCYKLNWSSRRVASAFICWTVSLTPYFYYIFLTTLYLLTFFLWKGSAI